MKNTREVKKESLQEIITGKMMWVGIITGNMKAKTFGKKNVGQVMIIEDIQRKNVIIIEAERMMIIIIRERMSTVRKGKRVEGPHIEMETVTMIIQGDRREDEVTELHPTII